MAKRWAAAAMLATEKNFRRVMGHKDMWALKAILDGKIEKIVDRREKVPKDAAAPGFFPNRTAAIQDRGDCRAHSCCPLTESPGTTLRTTDGRPFLTRTAIICNP